MGDEPDDIDDLFDGPDAPPTFGSMTADEIKAELAAGEAELAAGLSVPLVDVLAELEASIERMRVRREQQETRSFPTKT